VVTTREGERLPCARAPVGAPPFALVRLDRPADDPAARHSPDPVAARANRVQPRGSRMDQRDHPEDGNSPEQDAAIAQRELGRGDLVHAMHHLAWALAADPHRAEWLALLEATCAKSDDPLRLAPRTPEGDSFAIAGARAAILAYLDRHAEAVPLLFEATAAKLETPYLPWAERWLRLPSVARSVDIERFSGACGFLLHALMQRDTPLPEDLEPVRRNAEAALAVIHLVREHHQRHARLAFVATSLLRRLGRPNDAYRLALRFYEDEPAWHPAIQVALAEVARGNLGHAVTWYERALELDPQDISAHLEIADLFAANGRYGAARARYARVLERDSNHAWAKPSYLAMTYRTRLEHAPRAELDALADAGNARAEALRGWLDRATPYLKYLPDPVEATLRVLPQLMPVEGRGSPALGAGDSLRLALSHLEAPSVRRAFEAQLAAWRASARVVIHVDKVPVPDPRAVRGTVDFVLWKYEGTEASPAVPPPSGATASRVAELASSAYDLQQWDVRAATIAARLSTTPVREVLATLVHWPECEQREMPIVRWVVHLQVAAALIASHMRGGVGALLTVLNGPQDWATCAAIVALTASVLRERDRSNGSVIEHAFGALAQATPQEGHTCLQPLLYSCWLLFPDLAPALRDTLAERIAAGEGWNDEQLPNQDDTRG
jgi:tetratricopeptide (TPR) repeat protein